jgi:hypothetical protein
MRNDCRALNLFRPEHDGLSRDRTPAAEGLARNGSDANGAIRIAHPLDVLRIHEHVDIRDIPDVGDIHLAQVHIIVMIRRDVRLARAEWEPRLRADAYANRETRPADKCDERDPRSVPTSTECVSVNGRVQPCLDGARIKRTPDPLICAKQHARLV